MTTTSCGALLTCVLLAGCADTPSMDAGGPPDASDTSVNDTSTVDTSTDSSSDSTSDSASDAGESGPRLVRFWGGLGTEPGQFIEPSSIEIDSEGFVYVAGHEDRFQKFTADGELVDIFGAPGTGDGEFNHPHGLAVDRMRGDLIYVGDQENGRLQVFQPDGTFVRQWGDELFQHIHDVGIDHASGDVFVGDLERNIVRRFTSAGDEVWQVGGTGTGMAQFNGVWGLSTDGSGNIYVADTNNARIQVLTADGEFIREWDGYEGVRFDKPTGVYVHADDTVYVCDARDESILLFDLEGRPLERWSLPDIAGFVTEPEDIVVDPTGLNIYIAEVRQARVLHLQR